MSSRLILELRKLRDFAASMLVRKLRISLTTRRLPLRRNNPLPGNVFRPMLLPDLSAALLSLKTPLKPEMTSLTRRAGGDGQVGEHSTLTGFWNLDCRRRRDWRGQARTLRRNRLESETVNGIYYDTKPARKLSLVDVVVYNSLYL